MRQVPIALEIPGEGELGSADPIVHDAVGGAADVLRDRPHAAPSVTVTVTAQTLPEAGASTRILEKLGFEKVRDIRHPEDGLVWEWEHRSEPHA